MTWLDCKQRAKKVVSDSPGLVDFAIGVVVQFLNCLTGKQITEEQYSILLIKLNGTSNYYMVATACPSSLASVSGSKIRVTFPQVRVQVTMIQVNE